jgi:ubiquinone/menaquinone biosynthesis C-methylase UbiE
VNINREEYYSNFYKSLQRSGIQGWGNSLIDRLIESRVTRFEAMCILEVGASSGEHLQFVSPEPKWSRYVGLDITPGVSDPELFARLIDGNHPNSQAVSFVQGTAEGMPFGDESFDLVVSTCLLAHVPNPERVLQEMKRVVKNGGQIVIGLPTDPGVMNRFIKTLITYPRMKKVGIVNPRLEYAREHVNGIGNLLELIKFHFAESSVIYRYFPSYLPSWNFNLAVIVDCKIKK